jgi:UDP-glucose 4-epimerase
MNILFTGASSFSGYWFVQELVKAGHKVTVVFRKARDSYEGMRRKRVEKVLLHSTPHFGLSFGDEQFLSLISSEPWDLFCHHAADVADYKSPFFDVAGAFIRNTKNLRMVLSALKEGGCLQVLLTGTVFEQNEGMGVEPSEAISPYGLSKGLTAEAFRFYTMHFGMKLGKFVISNPFGPYEEERFTTYLAKTWLKGAVAHVNAPLYIRDNIPISLLAKAYAQFASQLEESPDFINYRPRGYVESLGAFTKRFSDQMCARFQISCPYILNEQQDFNEPLSRVNSEILNWSQLDWDENGFWDQLAVFYKDFYAS